MITEKIGKLIEFNPSEALSAGSVAKKIAMEKLVVGDRRIKGYDYGVFSSGAKFRNGDTLLAKITPCLENGKTAQVDILEDDEIAFGSTEFIVLRETEFIDKDYLFYLARSPHFRQLAISSMEGTSGRKRVAESALQSREITIPKDKKEQQKIAKVLYSLDKKIELNNKIISELEQMAKELYDYWFVQFDFPDANGKPYRSSGGKMVYNPTLKREIPEGWGVEKLIELMSEFTKGVTTEYVEHSTLINLNQKVNRGFSLDRSNFKYLDDTIPIQESKFAREKDILINSLGQGTLGRVHFFAEITRNIVVDQHLFILRTKLNSSALFVYQQLSSDWGRRTIASRISGSTGMQMLNGADLQTISLLSPTTDLLHIYEGRYYSLFQKKTIVESQNTELTSIRDWLLPMLMNGQVTVQVEKKKKRVKKLQ